MKNGVNKKTVSEYLNGIERNPDDELLPVGMQLLKNKDFVGDVGVHSCNILARSTEEVIWLSEQGVDEKNIYYILGNRTGDYGKDQNALCEIFGKCRILADSYEAFSAISQEAERNNKEGYLQPVGVYISEPLSVEECAKLRQLKGISVRGCFIDRKTSEMTVDDAVKYIHEAYQIAKRLTVDIPCAMPFMCFRGVAALAHRIIGEEPDEFSKFSTAMDIVSMQNDTAFYAKLLVD